MDMSHPATKFHLQAIVLLFSAFLTSLAAIFVGWSVQYSSTGGQTTVGLWTYCVDTMDAIHTTTCKNHDLSGISVVGSDTKCQTYFRGTQVMAIVTTAALLLNTILAVLTAVKVWYASKGLIICTLIATIISLTASLLTFIFWIVYASSFCTGVLPTNVTSPLNGYAIGFILEVVTTGLILLSWLMLMSGALLGRQKQVFEKTQPQDPVYYGVIM